MQNTDRDITICQLYTEGWTQEDLANRFHVSTVRIGQIIHKGGLMKEDRPRMVSERGAFTGVYLRSKVKRALREEAQRSNTSMSLFISDAVEAELKRRGVVMPDSLLNEIDVPLPLEAP